MLLTSLLIIFLYVSFRTLHLIWFKGKRKQCRGSAKTLIVIGSGGHTLEMLKQVKTLNPKLYSPRLYVMADVDTSSEYKINEVERELEKVYKSKSVTVKIPRSRFVNQSYFTSVFTTLYSTLISIPVVFNFNPDLILCNGPGTCIPVCVIGILCNILFFFNTKIVFIESICRVKTLSLSGKILLYLADVVIVQWPDLHKIYPNTVYLGTL